MYLKLLKFETMEELTIKQIREEAIKSAEWDVKYHEDKLVHAKAMLQIIKPKHDCDTCTFHPCVHDKVKAGGKVEYGVCGDHSERE